MLEATLFGAGRPLFIVPPAGVREFGRTIAVAWNGGTQAARAVGWALPFLESDDAAGHHKTCAHDRGAAHKRVASYHPLARSCDRNIGSLDY